MSDIQINIINILLSSGLLKEVLPEVRLRALLHTIIACKNESDIKNILLENLSESPYIEKDKKNLLVNLVLNNKWDILNVILKCKLSKQRFYNGGKFKFSSFRKMVILIFMRSKKIMNLSIERKNKIGELIHRATNESELKSSTINLLENSEVFDLESKYRIANLIFDCRYDLLLLPKNFDCEQKMRLSNLDNQELPECPICLGTNSADTKLICNHNFCKTCLESWLIINSTCPLCRKNISII